MNPVRGLATRAQREGEKRYELGAQIATGGMAVIRRGFDRWTQREIAHKRLRVDHEGSRPRMNALFQREYDTLARLKHPNIVEVYDYAFDEQGPYYAMELLSGEDLARLAPLTPREACRVLRDVASALALVHARRFVHRDVSPNNVRLTSEGTAKLIDFGALTQFGMPAEIAGTPAFIAPECLQDVELDQRADLYSLGALAYWTLTKRVAVNARSIAELQHAWNTPVVPPSSHVMGLPDGLDELVMSLLSHAPEARPASAAEVIERLSNIGELEPEQSEQKVAYSYLKHPPLVARELPLRELRSALSSMFAGRGEVVFLDAASGLGKSALLDQLAVDAQLRGATVLRAEGNTVEDIHGVARRLIRLGTRIFPDLEGSESFALSEVNSAAQTTRTLHPVETLERNTRAAARLREMLLRLGERSALLILIDDAERADDESIALLASMADELSQLPIMLVLSRGTGTGVAPSRAYERLEKRARQVHLQSLDEDQLAQLTASMFGPVPNSARTAGWLHRQTGGNPAQCIDLLRRLMQRGLVRYTRGTFALPHDIDDEAGQERRLGGLLTRLTGLSEDAAQLIELVALHQGALDYAQLGNASGLGPRRVLLAVEQLFQRELVFQAGAEVSLRGESMRTAIEQSLASEHKHALHRALANAVTGDGSLAAELARVRHLLRSGAEGELSGAQRVAALLSRHGHELVFAHASLPLLEETLAIFRARGVSERHCAPLLAALASTGFYGNIAAQEKYLRPAMRALSAHCGFDLAARLRGWLGKRVALWIGLVYGFVLGFFLPKKLGRTGIKQRIEDFLTVASAGMGAAAAVSDTKTAAEIVAFLRPLQGFSARFAPSYSVEFCLATSELVHGDAVSARARYRRLIAILQRPRFALHDRLREQLLLGCLHGGAHAEIECGSAEALTLADEMERRSAFFAPHAEAVRVVYHSSRGFAQLAEQHRARAEALALRGGVSWTAASLLAVRTLEAASLTGDAMLLMRSSAELERMSHEAPCLARYHELALSQLALLRGKPGEAEARLRACIGSTYYDAAYRLLYPTYTEALVRVEQAQLARTLCESQLAATSAVQLHDVLGLRSPYLPLIGALLALGDQTRAAKLLDERLALAAVRDNPLELGLLHAAYARLALQQNDASLFDLHYEKMVQHFKLTGHPGLARQCGKLLSSAIGHGIETHVPDDLSWLSSSALNDGSALDGETVVESRPMRDLRVP